MQNQIRDFADLMREEEEAALNRTRAEIASEDAKWNALPQSERDRINAARSARLDAFFDAAEINEDEDEDEDEDDA